MFASLLSKSLAFLYPAVSSRCSCNKRRALPPNMYRKINRKPPRAVHINILNRCLNLCGLTKDKNWRVPSQIGRIKCCYQCPFCLKVSVSST